MVLMSLSIKPNRSEIINQQDEYGETPLHWAAKDRTGSFAWDLLISNGANPEIKCKKGESVAELLQIRD